MFCDGVILFIRRSLCCFCRRIEISVEGRKCRKKCRNGRKIFCFFLVLLSTANLSAFTTLLLFSALSRCYYALRVYFVYSRVSLYIYIYIIYISISLRGCSRARGEERDDDDDDDDDGKSKNHSSRSSSSSSSSSSSPPLRT